MIFIISIYVFYFQNGDQLYKIVIFITCVNYELFCTYNTSSKHVIQGNIDKHIYFHERFFHSAYKEHM